VREVFGQSKVQTLEEARRGELTEPPLLEGGVFCHVVGTAEAPITVRAVMAKVENCMLKD